MRKLYALTISMLWRLLRGCQLKVKLRWITSKYPLSFYSGSSVENGTSAITSPPAKHAMLTFVIQAIPVLTSGRFASTYVVYYNVIHPC